MPGRRRRKLAAAGALLLASQLGCAEYFVQVRASKPHADVLLRIVHDDEKEQLYDDTATVDGIPINVGSGRGGRLTLRLSPGKHEISLSSATFQHDLTSTTSNEFGGCVNPSCTYTTNKQADTLGMDSELGEPCVLSMTVELSAGQHVTYSLVSSKNHCPGNA